MVQHESLLLVEDDSVTRELLTLLLQAEGWTVQAVENGEQAIDNLQQSRSLPAVVLCDLHLPGLCGEALAHAIHVRAPGLCLIAMSATPNARVAGYFGGLLKPFPPDAVQQEWERHMTRAADAVSGGSGAVEAAGPGLENAADRDTADLPIVDPSTLLELQRAMGARGAQGLYAFALADTGDRLKRMEQAVADGDVDVFKREAHAIKGSCGMIGARRLWRLANDAELEVMATSGKTVSGMAVETQALRLMLETQFPVQQQML